MRVAARLSVAIVVCTVALWIWTSRVADAQPGAIALAVHGAPVVVDPADPGRTAFGDFSFAGGLVLSATPGDRFHGLSDLTFSGTDRIVAVGDEGVLVEARLVFDVAGRLAGVSDASLAPLTGEDGRPVTDKADADAEGVALLPGVGRLVSFERRHRIVLYPESGPPRRVPAPAVDFPANGGMEALGADPDVAPDAYVVGAEETGETWTCRISAGCEPGPRVPMPDGFGLVAVQRLGSGRTAYLLRAWDPQRGNRITLRVSGPTGTLAELDLARPLTVDNFEGVAATPLPDGRIRFFLLSDDNASSSQRTLLLAFDWQPRQ